MVYPALWVHSVYRIRFTPKELNRLQPTAYSALFALAALSVLVPRLTATCDRRVLIAGALSTVARFSLLVIVALTAVTS